MRYRLPLAFVTLLFGAVAACSDAPDGAPANDDEASTAERSDAIIFPTLADDMVWTNPAHDTIALIPGDEHDSVTDTAHNDHDVYQVLVDPRPNTTNGKIVVYKFWQGASAASCADRALSVRAQVPPIFLNAPYTDLVETNVTSTFKTLGSEFPVSGCEAKVTVNYASGHPFVRVMAQARTRITLPGVLGFQLAAVSVEASGKSPAPDLWASITAEDDGGVRATITNDGDLDATSVDSDITYEYDYCPPNKPGEPFYCTHADLNQGQCIGPYCGPGTNGSGQRTPLKCSWTKDFPEVGIGAHGGAWNWVWDQNGTQAGCAPCVPQNNRCANPHARIIARSTNAPYSAMDPAISHDYGPDVL